MCFRPLAGMCCVFPFCGPCPCAACFRPLAGMCCVVISLKQNRKKQEVSVPWRGCVVSSEGFPKYGCENVSVPWRGCVVSWQAQYNEDDECVSVPWRGCVVSRFLAFTKRFELGFRPLAGMCCVPNRAEIIQRFTGVSVPWRGCVVSWKIEPGSVIEEFPSPGGDVLCQDERVYLIKLYAFPSPGGDVLCRCVWPKWWTFARPCFRPLAGMCCV